MIVVNSDDLEHTFKHQSIFLSGHVQRQTHWIGLISALLLHLSVRLVYSNGSC